MVSLSSGLWLRSTKRPASFLFSQLFVTSVTQKTLPRAKKVTIKCVYNSHLIRHLHISWVLHSSHEKWKTMLVQNLGGGGGANKLGDVQVANALR